MSDDEETFDMFQEPAGYFQEEKKPTFVQHQLSDGTKLDLRLVGHNPLWVSRSHKVFSLSIFEFIVAFWSTATRAPGTPTILCSKLTFF